MFEEELPRTSRIVPVVNIHELYRVRLYDDENGLHDQESSDISQEIQRFLFGLAKGTQVEAAGGV